MLPPVNGLGPLAYVSVWIRKVSRVPGSSQSSTSTIKNSVVVPLDRVTSAQPVKVACVFTPQGPGSMTSESIEVALIRTFISWSLYSRFPFSGQHRTTKPNVAFPVGLTRLGINAGNESNSPSGEKSGSCPGICPPPVTFPGVDGTPPRHGAPGAGASSHGVKSASPTTSSPVPPGLVGFTGPVGEPHQLHSASTVPIWLPRSTVSPVSAKLSGPT